MDEVEDFMYRCGIRVDTCSTRMYGVVKLERVWRMLKKEVEEIVGLNKGR
jgi:hypothetical protein